MLAVDSNHPAAAAAAKTAAAAAVTACPVGVLQALAVIRWRNQCCWSNLQKSNLQRNNLPLLLADAGCGAVGGCTAREHLQLGQSNGQHGVQAAAAAAAAGVLGEAGMRCATAAAAACRCCAPVAQSSQVRWQWRSGSRWTTSCRHGIGQLGLTAAPCVAVLRPHSSGRLVKVLGLCMTGRKG